MVKERETYTPTRGVENEGYEFEVGMLAFYCFNLCCNELIKDFNVAIYDSQYQPFDDIVIDITTETTEKYAIQLKHVKDKLPLTPNHFGKNGKMVLGKHFKFDFMKSDHVVLLTNGVLNEEMTVDNYSIIRKTSLTTTERHLDTSGVTENHVYEIYDEEKSKKITFYTSQKSRNDVDEALREHFRTKFFQNGANLDGTVQKYKSFFHQWKKGTFGFCKLDKEDIKMKIAEIVFYDHIVDYNPEFLVTTSKKTNLLQQVLNNFTVTLAPDIDDDIWESLCCFSLNKTEVVDQGEKFLTIVNENSCKDQALILWRLKKFPLIIRINNDNKITIQQVINRLQNEDLSFVLIGQCCRKTFTNLNVLVKLSDLEGSGYYETIVEEFHFSIQGQQDVSLKKLIECNPRFSEIFTIKELLLMLKGNFVVGETEKELPEPYISRQLLTTILKINSLEHFPRELFVISGSPKFLQQQLTKWKFFKFEEFVEVMSSGNGLPPKSIVLCEENAKCFATCLKYKNSNVHCLKVMDHDHLQLVYSKEKSEVLRQFQLFPEDHVHSILKNNINLVCASPGMGKTTLLKNLRNNCPAGYWTVKINLQENQHLQNDAQNDSTFESAVKNCFKEVHRVTYFFCGIDNLQNEKLVKATQYIQQLAKDNFRVWVFSEDYSKEKLEKIFEVLSMDIEAFSEEQQQKYIEDRLKEHRVNQELDKALLSFKMLKNNDILGAPMHLYMLTEIFINDPKARMEEVFVLTDIYKYFINTKYQHYLKKVSSEGHNQIIDDGIYFRTEQYKLAAISCLDSTYFRNVQCDRHFLEQLTRIGDVVGVIFKINNDGSIIFSQQTYADYFAALWLVNNHQKVGPDFFFQNQYKNIFFMFNLEICKNYPAHMAVLYQNFDQLQKCPKLDEIDPLGRSTLHVACCYGTRLPKLQTESLEKTFIFSETKMLKEDVESRKILDYLMNKIQFNPLQTDVLFFWNLLDYAFNVLNLYAIETILIKFAETAPLVLNKLKDLNNDDLLIVIYFCVKFGYIHLLKLTVKISTFSNALSMENCNGENLLYMAVKSGKYETVTILLDQGASIDSITSTYHKRSPLHLAVDCCYEDIVQLLLEKRAFPDIMDRYRNIPLHLASSKGLYHCTQLLIEHGSDVNFGDNFGRTSLQLAATHGHLNIIKLLVDRGAIIDKCDRLGNTPLSCANDKKHSQISYLLSKEGAKIPTATSRRPSTNEFEEYTSYQLHWAASTGQAERILPLLQDGWNINEVDHLGRTPLYRAVTEKYIKIVQILIAKDADVNIPDNNKLTPLCQSIRNCDLEMTSLLLENMSDIDVTDNFNYTPLHWGAMRGDSDTIKLMLSKNPDVDVLDSFRRRPVECAAEHGHHETVAILECENIRLQAIARKRSNFLAHYRSIDHHFKNTLNLTPFEEAINSGNTSLVKKFLRQDKDVNEVDSFGYTLLHRAVVKQHKSIVKLLLEKGADVHKRDKCRSSSLHWAAYVGNLDIVKLLIRYEPDVDAVDVFGYNSLQLAAMGKNAKVLEVLLEAGCDAKAVDFCGNSSIDWASRRGCVECVQVLLKTDTAGKTQEAFLDMTRRQYDFLRMETFHRNN